MQTKLTAACNAAANELGRRGVPQRYWSCGSIGDDRIFLVLADREWQVGYAERGEITVFLRTEQSNLALDRFVAEAERACAATERHVAFSDAD
jgi:hypothetical protein